MTSVFLSYSRDNKPIADRLYHDLKRAGLSPWQDTDLATEIQWGQDIRGRIEAADAFILLASPEAADPARYVVRELAEAERLNKRILRVWVAGEAGQLPAAWTERHMIDARGRYWQALPKLLADLGGQAVSSPRDLIADVPSLSAMADQLHGAVPFRAAGHSLVRVPVVPSGYGMGWLVGPADDPLPDMTRGLLPPIAVLFKFTGPEHDDSLAEVVQYLVSVGRTPWVVYVEGPKQMGENRVPKYELPNDGGHVWADQVELSERAVREWVKGRHQGMSVFFHGPNPLAFAVGSRLREMLPYELLHYPRGQSRYTTVFGAANVK
ncbi:toll/interleukin-1 receptor domain-containing protein [Fimbriiglobus ruber]|uniref:TIR domain-containing protein n=1 Tax=Fimbriiglobus ruber TaxID=1908690 RepID=A0A225DVD3_9BACT|nr:toll/interleukin-1 receptor domain-containing protein [Fimbriiglobus ruber]OWK41139.1 hypothetical protein FRUB_05031 [Fimbriiglobus ruber]